MSDLTGRGSFPSRRSRFTVYSLTRRRFNAAHPYPDDPPVSAATEVSFLFDVSRRVQSCGNSAPPGQELLI